LGFIAFTVSSHRFRLSVGSGSKPDPNQPKTDNL
jgi:hypothetical protein